VQLVVARRVARGDEESSDENAVVMRFTGLELVLPGVVVSRAGRRDLRQPIFGGRTRRQLPDEPLGAADGLLAEARHNPEQSAPALSGSRDHCVIVTFARVSTYGA